MNEIVQEMVDLMQERLSDDLCDRYYDYEAEVGLAEEQLIEKWKNEIEMFKQNCLRLGISETEWSIIEGKILTAGLQYLKGMVN